jgi:hypothetical protein
MPQLSPDDVRHFVDTPLTNVQAKVLADWYTSLSAAVAAFPEGDLRGVEPPLRSTPAPSRE